MRPLPTQPNLDFSSRQATWSVRFWLLVIVAGAAAGLAGGGLMRLLKAIEHICWQYGEGSNLLEGASRTSATHRVLMLLAAGIVVGAGGRLIRAVVGKPSEVNAAIWFRSGKIPLIATLAAAIHSIVIVGMGTSLGRESPIKQAGGALASGIAGMFDLSRAERRLLVACGVGAGMAAAYNVPVGGALFAVEVLIGSISMRMMLPALLCSGVATVASWTMLPTGSIYQVPEYPLSIQLTVWAILAGPLLGLASVPLVRLIGWADRHRPQRLGPAIFAPIIALTILGFAAIDFPQLLGNGKDVVQLAFANQIIFSLLILLPLLKLIATAGCLGSGASGGLFTPAMTIGALLGGAMGHIWNHLWPGASMGSCAVIGSCAFLAAATMGPLSALVLVLELTRHIDATMAPMLLCTAGAVFVARRIDKRSIYSVRLHLDLAELPPDVPSDDVIFAATGYAQISEMLLATRDEPRVLFVVDDKGALLGRITAETLLKLRPVPIPLEAAKAEDFYDEIPVESRAVPGPEPGRGRPGSP
jgi:CIC family chloride channel protein